MQKAISKVVALFAIVTLSLSPLAPAAPAEAAVSGWSWKAVSIVSRNSSDFTSENFKQSVRNAKAMGANTISLVIPFMQDNYQSSNIYSTWQTPSDETLGAAIDYIHSQGLKASLKPHLEVSFSGWRALIEASDRDAWYASYLAMLRRLAAVAKDHGAEQIVIGTELIGMASPYVHPNNTTRWQSMISDIRTRYSGHLTYSANWGRGINHTNEFEQIGFWSNLDSIGISAYFELSPNSGSVQSIMESWQTIDRDQIQPLQTRIGKPVIFTEIGYRSVTNAHTRPWDYEMGGSYDPTEQVNSYEALLRYWDQRSYMSGVLIWDWHVDPNYGGSGNTDYTPRNKPAEDTIKRWFTSTTPTPTDPTNPGGGTSTTTPTNPGTGTPSSSSGTWTVTSETVKGARVGNQIAVPLSVSVSGSAQNVITDVEIYNSAGTKIHQKFYEGQSFTGGTPQSYSVAWTPTAQGIYTVKLGMFKSDWTQNYYWNNYVTSVAVASASQTTTPTTPTAFETDVWWPSNGATIAGVQPFKAMLKDKPINEYTMYWQVEGGPLTEMPTNMTDYPHKETSVDVSSWNWKGTGPYTVTFVSKDLAGNVIGQKSVSVSIWQP